MFPGRFGTQRYPNIQLRYFLTLEMLDEAVLYRERVRAAIQQNFQRWDVPITRFGIKLLKVHGSPLTVWFTSVEVQVQIWLMLLGFF